jgi:predicted dienelactone hydrolase
MRSVAMIAGVSILLCASAFAGNVGFEEVRIANGAESPLTVGIWYPTRVSATEQPSGNFTEAAAPGAPIAGNDLPLVVMSHGGGGWYDGHADTAQALASAGFVAAAVGHSGDTFDDQSKVLQLWRRPAQLRRLVDYMVGEWPDRGRLDSNRIGAFGFSNGGFTVLVAAGGVPDLSKGGPYCEAHPDHELCLALKQAGVDPRLGADAPRNAWVADRRIKSAVIAAPAFAFAFGADRLRDVHIPIQLWRAADDRRQPYPFYEDAIRAALPQPPEYHVVANAGHYDFLAPCNIGLFRRAPGLCSSDPSFDRAAFHTTFNAEVVRFFVATLHLESH